MADSSNELGKVGDDIEIGEDIEMTVVVDGQGLPVGAVVDDLIVATGPDGSIVDETIDVLDADGRIVLEDERVDVYDQDGNLVATSEQIIERD